jgi:5-methylcytosine-specific restriction endonuclease McrA
MDIDLRNCTNEELTASLKALKVKEDLVLVEVLAHIQEIERRQLFLKLGHPSLYSYLMTDLGYTESEAYRRIESARFLRANPELTSLVQAGHLTLTSISEVRSAVRYREKATNNKMSPAEQVELAKSVSNCTRKQTQQILAEKIPDFKPLEFERKQELQDGGIQITLRLDQLQRRKSDRTRDIMARTGPITGTAKLYENLCDFFLRKKDLAAENSTQHTLSRQETLRKNPPSQINRNKFRNIPMSIRRAVFKRDSGRCQFRNPEGKPCGSPYQIEIDHILPLSRGGTNEIENLRCLCRAHNQWKADRIME